MKDKAKISFNDFVQYLQDNPKPKELREGQYLMNTLFEKWHEEYERISATNTTGGDIDCFYRDILVPNTWKHLEKVWKY